MNEVLNNEVTKEATASTSMITTAKKNAAVITDGMVVTGDVTMVGPLEVYGTINGNVDSNDLVNILGEIRGNINASVVHLNEAVVVGDVRFSERVEISKESIVVGSITGDKSISIAGSIKGNIDVKEELILLSGAVIVGDVKCKAIRVEPGVSIKGSVDQCYADIDVDALFGDY